MDVMSFGGKKGGIKNANQIRLAFLYYESQSGLKPDIHPNPVTTSIFYISVIVISDFFIQ